MNLVCIGVMLYLIPASQHELWRTIDNQEANCLAFLMKLQGTTYEYAEISRITENVRSVIEFKEAAVQLGLDLQLGRPSKSLTEEIQQSDLPFVSIHRDAASQSIFYRVVLGLSETNVTFLDCPSVIIQNGSYEDFVGDWTGIVMYQSNGTSFNYFAIFSVAAFLLFCFSVTSIKKYQLTRKR